MDRLVAATQPTVIVHKLPSGELVRISVPATTSSTPAVRVDAHLLADALKRPIVQAYFDEGRLKDCGAAEVQKAADANGTPIEPDPIPPAQALAQEIGEQIRSGGTPPVGEAQVVDSPKTPAKGKR